jgi:hypothetical protein
MTTTSTGTPTLARAASSASPMLPASSRAGIRIETSIPGSGLPDSGARNARRLDAPTPAGRAASANAT